MQGDHPDCFNSRTEIRPTNGVLLLGAGASAPGGCPLVREFIDRALDWTRLEIFSTAEQADVKAALKLYSDLRADLRITEEDIDNVETLLSMADLAAVLKRPPVEALRDPQISDRLRRFVNTVIARSVRMPSPASAIWVEPEGAAFPYKALVRALAHYQNHLTVITLNYDCLIEYACHCMGLPFVYNRDDGGGVEILKLHGSTNWLRCPDTDCKLHTAVKCSPMQYQPHDDDSRLGYIKRTETKCQSCGKDLVPLIVPPTWSKRMDHPILRGVWSRAVEILYLAETFIAIGYSLPATDVSVRHLLHLGFSSAALRQALVVIGEDEEAARRWNHLFRYSWRTRKFELHQCKFEDAIDSLIYPALVIPGHVVRDRQYLLLPLSKTVIDSGSTCDALRAAMGSRQVWCRDNPLRQVGSWDVARRSRQGQLDSTDEAHLEIAREVGLLWVADETMPAVAGKSFAG